MADDADIRRENFRALVGNPFSPTETAARLWGTPQLWSDLYHGRKAFGEKIARRIEEKLVLARMSLDDPGGARPACLSAELMAKLQELQHEDRINAENLLRLHLRMPPLSVAAPPAGLSRKRQPQAA